MSWACLACAILASMAAFSALSLSISWLRNLVVSLARLVRSRISSLRIRVTSSLATRDCDRWIRILKAHGKHDRGSVGAPRKRQLLVDRGDRGLLLHQFDKLSHRHQVPLVRKHLEFVDDGDQVVSRHQPLLDDLDALLGSTGHRRAHQIGRNLLGLNQYLALRPVGRGPNERQRNPDRGYHNERDCKEEFAALEQLPIDKRAGAGCSGPVPQSPHRG